MAMDVSVSREQILEIVPQFQGRPMLKASFTPNKPDQGLTGPCEVVRHQVCPHKQQVGTEGVLIGFGLTIHSGDAPKTVVHIPFALAIQ